MTSSSVAEMMSRAENQEILNKMRVALDADEEAARIMENADSIDDLYTVVSRYIKVRFEDFRKALESTVEHLSRPKTMLSDDMLECVTAAGIWNFLKNNWKTVVLGTVGVALAATGIGVIVAGVAGTTIIAGGTIGAVGFGCLSGAACSACQ